MNYQVVTRILNLVVAEICTQEDKSVVFGHIEYLHERMRIAHTGVSSPVCYSLAIVYPLTDCSIVAVHILSCTEADLKEGFSFKKAGL